MAAVAAVVLVPTSSGADDATPHLSGPPPTITQYGYVRSLTRTGSSYRLDQQYQP